MQNEKMLKLKPFKNGYCDAISSALSAFIKVDDAVREMADKCLSQEEIDTICSYSALKNKLAGVEEVNLKVPRVRSGINALEKYNLKGYEILDANYANGLSASDLLGGRLMLEIEHLEDHNQGSLADISDFCGRTQIPILIHFGRDLESVGEIVNKFSSSPATLLEEYGFLDRECYLYGMNYIDKDDQLLLSQYAPTLILSPRSDGEEGKGGINLYNLIYNRLKFVFSSGKCYNIDMLKEGKLALLNTNNLMNCSSLVGVDEILEALSCEEGEILLDFDPDQQKECILEEKCHLADQTLNQEKEELENKIKQIVIKLKEKINGN